jgi:hypothetical protein
MAKTKSKSGVLCILLGTSHWVWRSCGWQNDESFKLNVSSSSSSKLTRDHACGFIVYETKITPISQYFISAETTAMHSKLSSFYKYIHYICIVQVRQSRHISMHTVYVDRN